MTYERFASWYDQLMSDAPYDAWCALVERTVASYHNGKRLLDLGCGTGELAIRLAEKGFDVTGVDLSEQMLTIAQMKAEERGVHVLFYQQDMRHFGPFEPFDTIVIFCDSLNYLLEDEDVVATFSRVYDQLRSGGLFLFDVHSLFKMEHIFLQKETFASNDEQVSYIWNCYPGSRPYSVEHELTFFVQLEEGVYERVDEIHVQRTYDVAQYETWLKDAGFRLLHVWADFTEQQPTNESERIFFVAQK
ncbi:class I SAM-dependent DNA methyltransferase [Anoxybacillus flavithermus]|uniref:class I SAM-dependent DNA methyltransferase n=1 Tax=Anoxybacillus flavithermus TaxID=33934 RepID=UPI0018695A1D|nr:class I SAM-dependent methyltransferase [Anoxybacillus flavithermus]MBE2939460.1 class I SAM-dependent methyltransferase [Anoxybacillus flavithermus]MBE2941975.1 class I SAM-dependent methyltransferase [Anoxybacillus flavithermus]MBE2950213.1 class I SAM-dependent methyltransferase [Anoxybacillus flavithermus]MBE2952990.1 class I SAM-dependent methyltransferase [Anoxybacillus flavithermus]MBE2958343.1 class I SAM-dependent methyltransferase [Anoxybacillus flavithermus]